MSEMDQKVGRSGNPFVDWGLAIAATMVGVDSVDELTLRHLKAAGRLLELDAGVHGVADCETDRGMEAIPAPIRERIRFQAPRLKAFLQTFTSNTPLHNPKPPKGHPPDARHIGKYLMQRLTGLADRIGRQEAGGSCQACGRRPSIDPHQAGTDFFGRDWFPLAGAGSEANLAPAASRSASFCPVCLVAVTFIPYAALLVNGKMTILQSAPPAFADCFVRETFEHVRLKRDAGQFETLGQGEGTKALTRRLLEVLRLLEAESRRGAIDSKTRLFAWYFSNTGSEKPQEADTVWFEEIPNPVLLFLKETVARGLKGEVERLLDFDKKESDSRPGFLRCVVEGRDYAPLYARGKHSGASVQLFELYQMRVLGRRPRTLQVARLLAERALAGVMKKSDRDALCRPDTLRSPGAARSRMRRLMVEEALDGRFSLADYRDLFVSRNRKADEGVAAGIDHSAWNVLSYYLVATNRSTGERGGVQPIVATPAIGDVQEEGAGTDIVARMADQVFARLVATRSRDYIRTIVLRGPTPAWLDGQYLQCARAMEGFTFDRWLGLALDDHGQSSPWEWLLQTRLRIAWRLASGDLPIDSSDAETAPNGMADGSGLPDAVACALGGYLSRYRRERGAKRLERDIVARWTRGEIGPSWIAARICESNPDAETAGVVFDEWLAEPVQAGPWAKKHQLSLAVLNAARRLATGAAGTIHEMEDPT